MLEAARAAASSATRSGSSDGRLIQGSRLLMPRGSNELSKGEWHQVEIRSDSGSWDLWFDGAYIGSGERELGADEILRLVNGSEQGSPEGVELKGIG